MIYRLKTDLNFGGYTILIYYCDSKITFIVLILKEVQKEMMEQ